MKDIEKLALYSKMAKNFGDKYEIIDIKEEYEKSPEWFDLSFHPNGNCGCILVNDDLIFGIQCNHLMWAEGCCEGVETFWKSSYELNSILVYGNHKGHLVVKLLVFHE